MSIQDDILGFADNNSMQSQGIDGQQDPYAGTDDVPLTGNDFTTARIDEATRRRLAFEEYQRNEAQRRVAEAQQVKKQPAQKGPSMDEFNALVRSNMELQAKIDQINGNVQKVSKNAEFAMDRFVTEDVVKDESDIMSDPVIGQYYNPREIRPIYLENADKGRHLSPYEAMAIKQFIPVARKLQEFIDREKSMNDFKTMPLGSSAQSLTTDELANVLGNGSNNEGAIRAWQAKQLERMGL